MILIIAIWIAAFFDGRMVAFAQPSVTQKPLPQAAVTQNTPRVAKSEEKKEELSKKLLERKNELRREEREHAKERRSTEAKERSK